MDNSISNYNPFAIEQQQVGKSAGELFYNKDILTSIRVRILGWVEPNISDVHFLKIDIHYVLCMTCK